MPRFVILFHDPPADFPRGPHWDFMLEDGPVLRTWALEREPWQDAALAAEALADHRKLYLDYEGPISDNRGTVAQWDAGTYNVQHGDANQLVVRLNGKRLQGTATLIRQDDAAQRWTFRFRSD